MNINGIITKEEKEAFAAKYMEAYKLNRIISILEKLFYFIYIALILFLLFATFVLKSGLTLLAVLFMLPITVDGLKENIWKMKHLKLGKNFEHTDKELSFPKEYSFIIDDEKITVNDKITVFFKDVVLCVVYKEYTQLVTKEKLPVLVKTDFDQQWQIFETIKENKTMLGFILQTKEKPPVVNERLQDYSKTVNRKKVQKKKRKVLLLSLALVAAGYLSMLLVAFFNSQSARDKNQYSYDEGAHVYFTSQIAEKYTETKSYKAVYDIFFDWAGKENRTVVAVTKENGDITGIDIFYRNENNTTYKAEYSHNPDEQIRNVEKDFVMDWQGEIRALSNYQYMAENYPYITEFMSLIGLDFELFLKDDSILTLGDSMLCMFTPSFYSCSDDEYSYVVYVSENDVKEPEKLTAYLDELVAESQKPYSSQNLQDYNIVNRLNNYLTFEITN